MHRRCVQSLSEVQTRTTARSCRNCSASLSASLPASRRYQSDTHREPRNIQNGKDLKVLYKDTDYLLRALARGPTRRWKHAPTRQGSARRLLAAVDVPSKSVRGLTSPQMQAQFSGYDLDDESEGSSMRLQAGAFVEMRRHDEVTQGIVLNEQYTSQVLLFSFLSSTGIVRTCRNHDVMFMIPNFVDQDLAKRCGMDEFAATEAQTLARVAVLKRIRSFEEDLEKYRVPAWAIADAYEALKSPDKHKWSKATIADVLKVSQQFPAPLLQSVFLMHKQLMNNGKYFVADPSTYQMTRTFYLRPQSHVDTIDAVTEMSRKSGGYFSAFGKKMRSLMEKNRQQLLESWDERPSISMPAGVTFDKQDAQIISFLLQAMRPQRMVQYDPYQVITANIIKKLGLSTDVHKGVLHELLIDLGVIAPWDDLASLIELQFDEALLEKRRRVTRVHASEEPPLDVISGVRAYRGKKKQPPPPAPSFTGGPVGTEELYAADPADALRHDFGDMPVYVIDAANAEELDDGVAFERVPGEPDAVWLHAHIADPTAILPPTHAVARAAQKRWETAYTVTNTVPMLPPWLSERAGLRRSTDNSDNPLRVLTFSAKVDKLGNIVDYKVRPGIIRNIIKCSYDEVDLALGEWTPSNTPFSTPPGPPPPNPQLTEHHLENINMLKEVANRLFNAWYRLPVFSFTVPDAEVSVSPKPVPHSPIVPTESRSFRGFPSLSYRVQSGYDFTKGSRHIISETMKAAGRVASLFFVERGVPSVRRSSVPPEIASESQFADILASRDSVGYVDIYKVSNAMLRPAVSNYTTEPEEHWPLGIPKGEGYVRVTSPLRRYCDLMMHWQIKHALLKPDDKPLFSLPYLQHMAREFLVQEKHAVREERRDKYYWTAVFLKRWMDDPKGHEGQHNPLENMTATLSRNALLNTVTMTYQSRALISDLGFTASLLDLSEPTHGGLWIAGQTLPAKLNEIRLGTNPFIMLNVQS